MSPTYSCNVPRRCKRQAQEQSAERKAPDRKDQKNRVRRSFFVVQFFRHIPKEHVLLVFYLAIVGTRARWNLYFQTQIVPLEIFAIPSPLMLNGEYKGVLASIARYADEAITRPDFRLSSE